MRGEEVNSDMTILAAAAVGLVAIVAYAVVLASYLAEITHGVNRLAAIAEHDATALEAELATLDPSAHR